MAMLELEFNDLPSAQDVGTVPAVYPADNRGEVFTPWVECGAMGADRASVEVVRESGDPSGSAWTVQVRNRGAPATLDGTLATSTTASCDDAIQAIDCSSLAAFRLRRSTQSGSAGRVTIVVTLRKDGAFDVDGRPAGGGTGAGGGRGSGPIGAKM